MENDDDDDEGQADMQPSAEVEQPPGILPGETAGGGGGGGRSIKMKNMTNPSFRRFQE